jgi:transposase
VKVLDTVHVGRPHRAGRPRKTPERLIADKGYDSNAVRTMLEQRGIEPIIPARDNNTVATHQDGRNLRRYRRRWTVERTISWLQNFRRLVVRWERSSEVYTALAHMACALVVMKRVLG